MHTDTLPASPSTAMLQLTDQCPEVLHNIFQNVDPTDLASLSVTCHFLNTIIQNDELLWKLHYLSRFVSTPTLPGLREAR